MDLMGSRGRDWLGTVSQTHHQDKDAGPLVQDVWEALLEGGRGGAKGDVSAWGRSLSRAGGRQVGSDGQTEDEHREMQLHGICILPSVPPSFVIKRPAAVARLRPAATPFALFRCHFAGRA